MSPELEKHLTEKYPKIFTNMYGDPKKSCMAFGISCGDGWSNIIDLLCHSIQHYIDSMHDNKGYALRWNEKHPDNLKEIEEPLDQIVATQVKEKFGGLRFYTNHSDDYVDGLIQMAELMSTRTCEVCGNIGKSRTGGWIRTLCDKHAEER